MPDHSTSMEVGSTRCPRVPCRATILMTVTHVNDLTTDELCAELDRRMSRNKASRTISAVAEVFGVHPSQIFAYDKQPIPSQARTLAMALVSEHHTLAETARIFQRKNHTTIISAKQRADALTRQDASFREKAKFVLNRLKA